MVGPLTANWKHTAPKLGVLVKKYSKRETGKKKHNYGREKLMTCNGGLSGKRRGKEPYASRKVCSSIIKRLFRVT